MGLLILRSRSRDESDCRTSPTPPALAVIPRLTRRLQYLPMLANVATLLGLLGTIFGLARRSNRFRWLPRQNGPRNSRQASPSR
jgi:hypothetical protein